MARHTRPLAARSRARALGSNDRRNPSPTRSETGLGSASSSSQLCLLRPLFQGCIGLVPSEPFRLSLEMGRPEAPERVRSLSRIPDRRETQRALGANARARPLGQGGRRFAHSPGGQQRGVVAASCRLRPLGRPTRRRPNHRRRGWGASRPLFRQPRRPAHCRSCLRDTPRTGPRSRCPRPFPSPNCLAKRSSRDARRHSLRPLWRIAKPQGDDARCVQHSNHS